METDGSLYEIYYATEIGPKYPYYFSEFNKIPGLIMEMKITRPNGLVYKMTTNQVVITTVPEYQVSIPSGYTEKRRRDYPYAPAKFLYRDSYSLNSNMYFPERNDQNKNEEDNQSEE